MFVEIISLERLILVGTGTLILVLLRTGIALCQDYAIYRRKNKKKKNLGRREFEVTKYIK